MKTPKDFNNSSFFSETKEKTNELVQASSIIHKKEDTNKTFDHNSEEGKKIDTTVLPKHTGTKEIVLPVESIKIETKAIYKPITSTDKILKVSRPSYTDNSEEL